MLKIIYQLSTAEILLFVQQIYLDSLRIYTIKISSKRINFMSKKVKDSQESNQHRQKTNQLGSNLVPSSVSYELAVQAIQNKEYDLARKILRNDTSEQHWHQCLKSKILFETKQPEKALKSVFSSINFKRPLCEKCLSLLVNILKELKENIDAHKNLLIKISQHVSTASNAGKQLVGCLKRMNIVAAQKHDQLDQSCSDLSKLYSQRGASFEKVSIEEISQGYRVAVAKSIIKPRQVIIFVPENQIITLETAKKNHISAKIANEEGALKSPKHSLLAVYLLIQKSRGQQSPYVTYINSLPKNLENFPVYYSDQLLQQLLGTSFISILNRKKADLKQDYNLITNLLQKQFEITYQEFVWARMIVCSRIFGIIMYGIKTDALVPIADMLNHKIPKMTTWSFSDNKQGFIIQNGMQSILKGEEIYDSYGSKCNSRFLLNYGFIQSDNYCNQVGIILKRNFGRRYSQHNLRISKAINTDQFKTMIMHFRRQAYYSITNQMVGEEQLENQQKFQKFINFKIELKAWQQIEQNFTKKLKSYKTSIREDKKLLAKTSLPQNYRNCIDIRLGEKLVLQFYVEMAKFMKQNYRKNNKKQVPMPMEYHAYLKTLPNNYDLQDR